MSHALNLPAHRMTVAEFLDAGDRTGARWQSRDGGPEMMTPASVPAHRSEENCLVPDLGVTCAPSADARLPHQPLARTEILSPTNVSRARAYRTTALV